MALGAGTAGVDRDNGGDDILLGALVGGAIGFPMGASLGVWLAGNETGGSAEAAGPVVGSLTGAAVGLGFGALLGAATDDPWAGAIGGSVVGGTLSLLGAFLGYELSSGPHPQPDEDAEEIAWTPILTPLPGGAFVGVAASF